jgi:hypothetical protein
MPPSTSAACTSSVQPHLALQAKAVYAAEPAVAKAASALAKALKALPDDEYTLSLHGKRVLVRACTSQPPCVQGSVHFAYNYL